jgi:hypothetical protein
MRIGPPNKGGAQFDKLSVVRNELWRTVPDSNENYIS